MIWKKITVYAKDEGSNLNTMTVALKSLVGCDILSLAKTIEGSYFCHAFFKAY